MLFNSLEFFGFFLVIFAMYYAIPGKRRWILLLLGSYYFYGSWKPEFLILIWISTIVDYWASLQMGKRTRKQERRPFLYLSLVTNLGLLISFKYANFLGQTVNKLSEVFLSNPGIPVLDIALPVGISFYTFQTLSYSVDVYNGKIKPETHPGIFALFVSFFPQLVAGPIERSGNLLPQFHQKVEFDYQRVASGLHLAAWGLFKKVVIADRLSLFVDEVFGNSDTYKGISIVLATTFFAFQIYCDFSGYSDMAIGIARALGFDLMLNFRRPYFAISISDFWRRWHISLSTWFRDYVYIPLGGNRVLKWRWYYNLMITFLVSGLWHGANWTFVVWGGFHGAILILEHLSADYLPKKLPIAFRVPRILFTFSLVCIGWVFFRAENIQDAFILLGSILERSHETVNIHMMGDHPYELILSLVFLFFLIGVEVFQEINRRIPDIRSYPTVLRWIWYFILVSLIVDFGVFEVQEFIYFQF